MSREIKFRVWDGKEMREPPPLNEWDMEDGEFWVEYCDNPIMQYTGLKDKNGEPIYEGDVLRLVKHGRTEDHIDMEVQFHEAGFVLVYTGAQGGAGRSQYQRWRRSPLHESMDQWQTAEIIGNIHEHPYLIPAT